MSTKLEYVSDKYGQGGGKLDWFDSVEEFQAAMVAAGMPCELYRSSNPQGDTVWRDEDREVILVERVGFDHTGAWTPAQYAIDSGWSMECVQVTAHRGVADEDAASLTPEQQDALLEWCREQGRNAINQ
jgi:hypothetical protein